MRERIEERERYVNVIPIQNQNSKTNELNDGENATNNRETLSHFEGEKEAMTYKEKSVIKSD